MGEDAAKDVENNDGHASFSTETTYDPLPSPTKKKKKKKIGGWRAVKYILANETFEKLASMSLIANITVYLRTKYNMDGIVVVNVVNIWGGSCNFLTMPGAVLSDAYLGRFLTLLIGSIAAMVGMGTMALGAALPELRPPRCDPSIIENCIRATPWQLTVLFLALGVIAIGAGCIRPCNIAFGADQFDTRTEKGRAQLSRFYNWWYFTFSLALLVALTIVVYVQTNVSWAIGYAIPTACFALSITFFVVGCSTYIYKKPQGSIFIDMAKVLVAAYRKKKEKVGCDREFYNPPLADDEIDNVKLARTDRLKFFDKAAIICHSSEVDAQGRALNTWRLCSVQQVEQLKSVIGIWPVWVSGIFCFVVMDQQNTFGILQAIQMNRKIGAKFVIPPAWSGLSSMIALSAWIFIYERVLIPLMKKCRKKDEVRLTVKERIRIGISMSILCMCVAVVIEHKRREQAWKAGTLESPMSVFYLVPQLVLSGLIEAFAAVAIMEYFTTQMPEHMRSIAGSIFYISLASGSYVSTAVVNIIYSVTGRHGKKAWLGGHDLNKNRLDYFYAIIGCVGLVNFFYFTFFASKFMVLGEPIKLEEKESKVIDADEVRDVVYNI